MLNISCHMEWDCVLYKSSPITPPFFKDRAWEWGMIFNVANVKPHFCVAWWKCGSCNFPHPSRMILNHLTLEGLATRSNFPPKWHNLMHPTSTIMQMQISERLHETRLVNYDVIQGIVLQYHSAANWHETPLLPRNINILEIRCTSSSTCPDS